MSASEFNKLLARLGLSVYASANVLGVSLRQAQRYSSADDVVSLRSAQHLRLLDWMVRRDQVTIKSLREQIGQMREGRFRTRTNNRDTTMENIADAERRLHEMEELFRSHPAGIKPAIPG
jgi:hypothetical protein